MRELGGTIVDESGASEMSSRAEKFDVTLNSNVLFAKDSAVIEPPTRATIAQVGEQLRARGAGILEIVGHTDDLGSDEHGLQLSQQRAEAVRRELGDAVTGMEVTVVGKGEAEPRVPNTSEANRASNRRVELHYRKG